MLNRLLEEAAAMTSRTKLAGDKTERPSALLTFAAALLASTLLLGACNTIEGMGDDAEEAGEEVEDAID
jgi:predicted small secreted protein